MRFTLAAMESQGRDIKLNEKRVEGYRNFATKLWNAARFCQSNGITASAHIEPPAATLPVNRWIIGETVKTVQSLDLAMAEFRFDESANTIYQFVWASFRSEEHTSELQSLMRISYAVFCLKKKNTSKSTKTLL